MTTPSVASGSPPAAFPPLPPAALPPLPDSPPIGRESSASDSSNGSLESFSLNDSPAVSSLSDSSIGSLTPLSIGDSPRPVAASAAVSGPLPSFSLHASASFDSSLNTEEINIELGALRNEMALLDPDKPGDARRIFEITELLNRRSFEMGMYRHAGKELTKQLEHQMVAMQAFISWQSKGKPGAFKEYALMELAKIDPSAAALLEVMKDQISAKAGVVVRTGSRSRQPSPSLRPTHPVNGTLSDDEALARAMRESMETSGAAYDSAASASSYRASYSAQSAPGVIRTENKDQKS